MTLTHIVFDLDGTLIDSERASQRIWNAFLQDFGYSMNEAQYGQVIGRRADHGLSVVRQMYALPISEMEMERRLTAAWEVEWLRGFPPMPGVYEVRQWLRQHAIPWGVATNSERLYAEHALERLGLRQDCRAIAGGDEVTAPKPAPDVYWLAAERLGVEPQHCLAVEDSHLGCRAAAAAGMLVIAIPHAQTAQADFRCAAHRVASLHALIPLLEQELVARPSPR